MNNLTLLLQKYINHYNQLYSYRIDTLKSMTEANTIACKSITGQFHDLKEQKQMFDKQQDKLASALIQVDQVESHLNEVESSINTMQSTIKRIKAKMLDYDKLKRINKG